MLQSMEECSIEIKGETEQIFKVLIKGQQEKMPFEGIEIAKTLARIPFFKRFFDINCQNFINLCVAQDAVEIKADMDVYLKEKREGKQRYLYVLLQGQVSIQSQGHKTRKLGLLGIFGQIELLFGLQGRKEQVITLSETKVMRIKEQSLLKIFAYKDDIINILHFLHVNKYFSSLSELQKMQLSLGLSRRSFERGEIIKHKTDSLQIVLFFVYGRAEVSTNLQKSSEKQYVIDYLQQMSTFGEYECVTGNVTSLQVKGVVAGAYYCMNFKELRNQEHKICDLVEQKAIPYPNTQELIFLYEVKSTLKKYEKKVIKNNRLFF